jgi:hypothetical protein
VNVTRRPRRFVSLPHVDDEDGSRQSPRVVFGVVVV